LHQWKICAPPPKTINRRHLIKRPDFDNRNIDNNARFPSKKVGKSSSHGALYEIAFFSAGFPRAFGLNRPLPPAMATRKVRYKKLNIKTPLPVLREDQLDSTEYEAITAETHIATGVEQAEENVSALSISLASAISRVVTRDTRLHLPFV
jgi:hypothetical protein